MMQEGFIAKYVFLLSLIVSEEGVMQKTSSRLSNPALRQGISFGIIIAIAEILLSLIAGVINVGLILSILSIVVSLGLYFFAGFRAAQVTGRTVTGALAGMIAGIVNSLISIAFTLIFDFLNFDALQKSIQAANPRVNVTSQVVITGIVFSVVVSLILAILFGLAMGAIGGMMGRTRMPHPPAQGYEEAMFEPPAPTPPASSRE